MGVSVIYMKFIKYLSCFLGGMFCKMIVLVFGLAIFCICAQQKVGEISFNSTNTIWYMVYYAILS
jgi:hypothetical protein